MTRPETWISVDVETSGPAPSIHSLLSIGACLVDDPEVGFYIELKPTTDAATESALAVSGLSIAELNETGIDPAEAMARFELWLDEVVPAGHVPIFAGFNAPFDWMFVADWFWRFLGRNPFGHSALDIKSYFAGLSGGTWADTSMAIVAPLYRRTPVLTHNALQDAKDQAELFRAMIAEAPPQRSGPLSRER